MGGPSGNKNVAGKGGKRSGKAAPQGGRGKSGDGGGGEAGGASKGSGKHGKPHKGKGDGSGGGGETGGAPKGSGKHGKPHTGKGSGSAGYGTGSWGSAKGGSANDWNWRSRSGPSPNDSFAGASAADSRRFVQQLSAARPESLAKQISGAPVLWQQCWADAPSHFALPNLKDLAVVLATIPFSADVPPPPLHAWRAAMEAFLEKTSDEPAESLQACEFTLNVVKKMLQFEWEEEKQAVKDALLVVLEKALNKLQRRNKDHRDADARINKQMDELEGKDWLIKKKKEVPKSKGPAGDANGGSRGQAGDDANGLGVTGPHHGGWLEATVEWLGCPALFTPALLPKMQGPGTKSGGVYRDPAHYFDTMQRLMVGMAFSEGHAALSPRCWEKECGSTLWPIRHGGADGQDEGAKAKNHFRCRTPGCRNEPVLGCKNSYHSHGLCERCAERERSRLLGMAGPQASSHIYDGRVRRADAAGRIQIDGFASRKPPMDEKGKPRPIHWKSTKRLACPNLVGIVRLGAASRDAWEAPKGRALRADDPILWGELVAQGIGKDEFRERERGRLCVNVSSIMSNFDPDTFAEGELVAIIDCMTFVPEYIPVLLALEKQKQQDLPFHDGVLLNLHRERPADMTNTCVDSGDLNELQSGSAGLTGSAIEDLVDGMIERSTLQPIREIRQDPHVSAKLKMELVRLVEQTTLDRGQLLNFIDSLRNPVHLTHGPPGTGKSYLGVVLVRALMCIRALWMKQNPSVGRPPIVVLSYKNHATDEFLSDLANQEWNALAGSSNGWRSNSVEMIRMGNPSDPRLATFAEKALAQRGDPALARCRQSLQTLQDLRRSCHAVCKEAMLFKSFQAGMFGPGHDARGAPEDEKARRTRQNNAAYEATEVLFACIVRAQHLQDDDDDDDDDPDRKLQDIAAFMTLDPDDHRCRSLQARTTQQRMEADLRTLYAGMQHYIEFDPTYSDPHEMLHMFLVGHRPLPQCEHHECLNLALDHDVPLCNLHRCHMPLGPPDQSVRCGNEIRPGKSYLCEGHACATDGCEKPRFRINGGPVELFCKQHACFKCVELGRAPAQEARDEPPRHVCWDHPLCCVPDCSELALLGENYCQEHSPTQCQHCEPDRYGRVRECKRPAISHDIPVCPWHADAFFDKKERAGTTGNPNRDDEGGNPELEAAIQRNSDNRRCQGKNKKKKPCGNRAMEGSEYCHVHAPREGAHRWQQQKEEVPQGHEVAQRGGLGGLITKAAATLSAAVGAASAVVADGVGRGATAPGSVQNEEDLTGSVQNEEDPTKTSPAPEEGVGDVSAANSDNDENPMFGPPPGIDFADSGGYDNIDEVNETDGMQHLREIFEMEDGDDADDDGEADFNGAGGGDQGVLSHILAAGHPPQGDMTTPGSSYYAASLAGSGQAGPQREPAPAAAPKNPREWSWEMPLEDRWEACQEFMLAQIEELRAVLELVKQQMPVARKQLQEADVRARAKVYENKTIIGGTIVGCIARLEAIKATRPFAIIVEEASEVLEPLLSACLCPSMVKFQMIGDHLQLKPGIMDKFDFMRVNKIDVSMFERLIQAPRGHEVPNGVLSVQRRMRKDICDLTREYYKDTVAIEDHEACATKRLPGAQCKQSFWQGREVPGIQSHIYLWTHSGEQSRADVGLSKINRTEANLAVYLAYYLVQCGVERSSIAVLTPYKGQLMLMRKLLLQDKTKNRLLAWDPAEPNQVRLSTVDRFQGDEADVVLISLVVDENSRTPFVKLVNRMIVLLSRARLGMFVLGNVGYFENRKGGHADVKHWMRTFELLQKPVDQSDNDASEYVDVCSAAMPDDTDGRDAGSADGPGGASRTQALALAKAKFGKPRVGSKLPLCCPQHPLLSCAEASEAEDLQLGFCTVSCEAVLPCSHRCGLKCHWPAKQHNKECAVLVDSPCSKHPEKLKCSTVFQHAPGASSGTDDIDTALMEYRCPARVKVTLPCSHEETMACHVEDEIASGGRAYPKCERPSPHKYIYPECGHELAVTCAQLEDYESHPGKVKKCTQLVEYHPGDCGHTLEVKCYLKRQYEEGRATFTCPQHVDVSLPRCGHARRVSCAESLKIERWSLAEGEARCEEVGVVREGVNYGPKDHICREAVKFVRVCGHEEEATCEEAFLLAAKKVQRPCAVQVTVAHPHCGHSCAVSCAHAQALRGLPKMTTTPCNEVHQGITPPFPNDLPRGLGACKEVVTLHRTCGHVQRVACGQARGTLPKCTEAVRMQSPLCGHEIAVPCHLQAAVKQCSFWPADVERALVSGAALPQGAGVCRDAVPVLPDAPVAACLKSCKCKVTVTKQCGHTYRENCAELLQIVSDGGVVKKGASCSEAVTRELRECGHEVTVPCKKWQQYVAGASRIPCGAKVRVPCWNAEVCGSTSLSVACKDASAPDSAVCCEKGVVWTCGAGKHEYQLQLCLKGTPTSCPGCNSELLENAVEDAQAQKKKPMPHAAHAETFSFFLRSTRSNQRPSCVVAACLGAVRPRESVVQLPLDKEQESKFWQAQASCLQKFKRFVEKSSAHAFRRHQFKPALLPVFYVLPWEKKLQSEQQDGFTRLRSFVKGSTLNGVVLHQLTPKNIRALASEAKGSTTKTLLCGYLYTAKANTDCRWPTYKTKAQLVRKWREDEGCDCVEFVEDAQSAVRKLVVWDPCPLYATHRAGPLGSDDLRQLADHMDTVPLGIAGAGAGPLGPSFVEFAGAGGGAASLVVGDAVPHGQETTPRAQSRGGASGDNVDVGQPTQKVGSLRGTWAENVQWYAPAPHEQEAQDDELFSDLIAFPLDHPVGDWISASISRDLLKKLSFLNKDAPSFAGKKLLEKLLNQANATGGERKDNADRSVLRLLLALEFSAKGDDDRAKETFESYCAALARTPPQFTHPLLLLALSRLGCPALGGATAGALDASQLLNDFESLLPRIAGKVLTPDEKHAVRQLRPGGAAEGDDGDGDGDADTGGNDGGSSLRRASSTLPAASAADQWADLKETQGCSSEAMERLLALTGLEKVKAAAVQLFKKGSVFAQMDAETRKLNLPSLNYVFLGNPGTGKTTVARLFARIMHDTGLRKKKNFEEIGGQELKEGGVDEFKKKAAAAMDGVLFIDEAYTLDPVGDKFKGGPVANELLTLAENERERLSFILAGYEDELNDKLFAYNPGFRSRFTEVTFDDFDEDELLEVWTTQRKERKWREADDRLGRVVVRRLAKMRGRKGFGNARDVRKRLEQACDRAMNREGFDIEYMVLEMEDAVGENPIHNEKLKKVVHHIEGMTGWARVKQCIRDLVKVCGENYERELNGQEPLPVFLNRLFLGNPGTGKTTCAKLYGKVLKHLDFLSNGEVVEKTAGDLGGQVVGESQQKTVALLENSRGKVLLIDEAYGLDDGLYGKQALNVLVEKVQGTEADDIAVLLLGYEEDMMHMLDNQNPGLRRRFAPEQAFRFEDYSEQQLEEILLNTCKHKNYKPSLEFREKALKKLEMQKRSEPHFGNAGSVSNLLKAALAKASSARKCSPDGVMHLEAADIDLGPGLEDTGADRFAELDTLYRMEEVKRKLQQLKNAFDLAEEEGDERPALGHFVFVGAPGTGKTTVARIMAGLLFKCGLLATTKVVETSGLNLTGEAVGQTKKKVEEELGKARGGVLFIDEAYELGRGQYGAEACSALVAAMTDPKYSGLVIVIAGYQADIQGMLDTNPGLKSRFGHHFEFPDWAAEDCVDLFEKKAMGGNFTFENLEVTRRDLDRGFRKLIPLKGWGNARDVTKLWDGVMQQRADRASADRAEGGAAPRPAGKLLTNSDVSAAMDRLVAARMGTPGVPKSHDPDADPFAPLDGLYRMDAVRQTLQELRDKVDMARREGEEKPQLGHFVFLGAPGTGKTTVARVMADILFKLDLVGRNHAVETSGLELTGEFVGATKKKVQDQLDKAKGGVLFIDEAYELAKGQYGAEAVTTLVAAMTDPQYLGLTIIIAGYQADINTMLDANAGLKSRFTHFVPFPDWTPKDCADFFCRLARGRGLALDAAGAGALLLQGFARLVPLKGWGNARDVQQLWEKVGQNRATRIMSAERMGTPPAEGPGKKDWTIINSKEVTLGDVKAAMDAIIDARLGSAAPRDVGPGADPFAPLSKLYRMDSVRQKLQQLRNAHAVAARDGEEPPALGHFVFVGSPGTGKTTVARVMADILFELGLIGRRNVEETTGLNLTGEYVGHTKKKVEEQLDKAKGGVLFIDEAYNMGKGQFGSEACDTLVAAMTNPQYAGLVVVIAGYAADIDGMLERNAGLKSRFAHTLEFEDWAPEDCVEFFGSRAAEKKFALGPGAAEALQDGFERLVKLSGWGNARDVGAVWAAANQFRSDRVVEQNLEGERAFLEADIARAMHSLIRGRKAAHGKKSEGEGRGTVEDLMNEMMAAPPPVDPSFGLRSVQPPEARANIEAETVVGAASSAIATSSRVACEEVDSDTGDCSGLGGADARDPGVSDEAWAELQMAKEEAQRHEEKLRAEEEERKRVEAEIEAKMKAEQHAKEEELARLRHEAKLLAEEEERKRVEAAIEAQIRAQQQAKEAHEARLRELARLRAEAEAKRREQERIQQRLRKIGNCPAGFSWTKVGGQWVCGGGSHRVSEAELHRNFSHWA